MEVVVKQVTSKNKEHKLKKIHLKKKGKSNLN